MQLWEVPRRTPLLAYINQEFVAIKRNCSDGTRVLSDCFSLAEGLGWRTAGSPLLTCSRDPSGLLREVPLPLSFCGAPPAIPQVQSKRNPSNTVGAERGHQRAGRLKLQSQKTSQSDHPDHSLSNSVKLSHAMRGHQRQEGQGREV